MQFVQCFLDFALVFIALKFPDLGAYLLRFLGTKNERSEGKGSTGSCETEKKGHDENFFVFRAHVFPSFFPYAESAAAWEFSAVPLRLP